MSRLLNAYNVITKELRSQSPAIRKVAGVYLLMTYCTLIVLKGRGTLPDVTESTIDNILWASMALLGVGNITDVWKKKK